MYKCISKFFIVVFHSSFMVLPILLEGIFEGLQLITAETRRLEAKKQKNVTAVVTIFFLNPGSTHGNSAIWFKSLSAVRLLGNAEFGTRISQIGILSLNNRVEIPCAYLVR